MILRLDEKYKDQVLEYVSKEPSINLFIIGDIEQHGFDKEYQIIWGKFDNKGNLKGVLLRYENNFIPYIDDLNEDVSGFKKIIKKYKGKKIISGKGIIVEKFKDILDNYEDRDTYFCELKNGEKLLKYDENVKIAKYEDAQKIYNLMNGIDEFLIKYSVEEISKKIKNKNTTAYFIENDKNELITIAQITAENSKSAMVVGVATKKEYREKGYMSKCLSKLCYDLLSRNKKLCLFYDNPKAGKIYNRIGFEEIGIWKMLVEK